MRSFVLAALFLATFVRADDDVRLERVATLDPPGTMLEIIKYDAGSRTLVGVDSRDRALDLMRLESLDPLRLEPFRRIPMPGEPTSVALHPDGKFAYVTTPDEDRTKRGRLHIINLETYEARVEDVGIHPDAVAVTPDGRWVIVANEAEGDDATPGSIGLYSIADGSYREVPGLSKLIGQPIGVIEPEFVAVDPDSRYAAVSCQENDAVALVSLRGGEPEFSTVVRLEPGAGPDGVDLLDDVLAVAEEKGQHVSFHRVDPETWTVTPLSRVDVRPLVDPDQPEKSRQPESVRLVRWHGRLLALVGIERGDRVLCLDLADPVRPALVGRSKTGDRPEGLMVIPDGEDYWVVTADEGKPGTRGTLTFARLSRKK